MRAARPHPDALVYEAAPGTAAAPLPDAHRPRRPDHSVLYRLVAQHWPAYLADRRARDPDGAGVPRFIEDAFESFLRCGILSYGFVRVRCDECHQDSLIGFSCKKRGFCPSCTARRMHDEAAFLVDQVFPRVPVRQWVFTFPRPLRLALFFDHRLATEVLDVCLRVVFSWQRKKARALGLDLRAPARSQSARNAAVSFLQRVGSDLRPNLHFHCLLPDGVFARPADSTDPDARPVFHPIDPPSDDDVRDLLRTVLRRVLHLLRRRGRLSDDGALTVLASDDAP